MHAQDRPDIDPKTLIDNRVSKYRELGVSFKNVLDELKSDAPQIMVIRIASRQITAVARAQYDWFPPSSAQQPGVETRAKPDIWTEPARFKAAQDAFALAADDFAKAVATGDNARIGEQARALGKTCGACHTAFRTEIHPAN